MPEISSETYVFSFKPAILQLFVHMSIFLEFNQIKQIKPVYPMEEALLSVTGGKWSYWEWILVALFPSLWVCLWLNSKCDILVFAVFPESLSLLKGLLLFTWGLHLAWLWHMWLWFLMKKESFLCFSFSSGTSCNPIKVYLQNEDEDRWHTLRIKSHLHFNFMLFFSPWFF